MPLLPKITALKQYVAAHKFIAIFVVMLVLYASYYAYGILTAPSTATRYVTTTVATGTIVASITETGQVTASSNIDIQSKSPGEVLSIPVVAGQHVDAGAALAYLDPTTAQQAVVSAQQALQSAQIALAKAQEPATVSALTSSQNALATAQTSLVQAHQNGYNDISTAFLNLPSIIAGLDTVLHGTVVPGRTSEQNENAYSDMVEPYDSTVVQYRTVAESSYQTAYASYTKALADFKSTPRDSADATIEALTDESYQTAASISDALKASTNFLSFVNTTLTNRGLSVPSTLTANINTLTGYTVTTNAQVAALSIDAANVAGDERAVAAAQASLGQLQAGADPLDIQSSQLSVQMKQEDLAVAKQNLADTVVRAPFAGTVAKLAVQQYETIGSGIAVATMVSDNQSVAISVNEVDAAKLKVGEKATLTFDALPNVSIAGTVSSVNTIGTVSSGVVSYDATVTFDTPNTEVKPGMSATADIITGTETGLIVPMSALKIANGQSYVEFFSPPLANSESSTGSVSSAAPMRTNVTAGLSDGTNVIIESGLAGNTEVVIRTIAGAGATAPTSAAQSTSLFGGGARGGVGGGGAIRALTR
ncbi:MAG: HlyD family efflux transporter periplasmic adaptor subunit [Patescibacteria group bacterium]|nr:HlyD family efflux transporter periplasmic adaptor subunit [Patescibacteria group bacterium]MDE2173212.1 HlyD family efflux transporter periplasmic adaptor subunit [Patescibacteria group bacterium]